MDLLMIFIMTVAYMLFVVFDFIPVYRGKKRKLICIYLGLLILSYSITFLIGLGVKIPSPAPPIKKVITSLLHI